MKRSSSPFGIPHQLTDLWHRHRLLIMLLAALGAAAGSSNLLGAILIGPPSPSASGTASSAEEFRTCNSKGTPFEGMMSLSEIIDLFQQSMSAVVGEREEFLSNSALWKCLSDEEAGSMLVSMAESLPAWHFSSPDGSRQLRPVTFASFASVVSEYEFAYECRLSELERNALGVVVADKDFPSSTGLDPTHATIAVRPKAFEALTKIERARARLALERTIQTLRSFEVSYAYAKQLGCFQRASLDLKAELTLLADTVSCMPKIWDAVTSLHDPKATEE